MTGYVPWPARWISGSTTTNSRRASRAVCASRTARRSGRPARRRSRRVAVSTRCGPSNGAARRPTTSSCTSWRRACNAAGASRRARAACRSGASWSTPVRRSPTNGSSHRDGSGWRSRCSARHRLLLAGSTLLALAQRVRPRACPPRSPAPRAAPWPRSACHRSRRVAVHRMRDGRVAARDPPRHRRRDDRRRCDVFAYRGGEAMLRRAPRARRARRCGPPAGAAGDGVDAG